MFWMSLDMSTTNTGWALWEGNKIKEFGCIPADKGLAINKRIHKMMEGIEGVLSRYEVKKFVFEDPLPRTSYNTNESTYRALNWLQGYICVLLKDKGYNDFEFVQSNSWRSKIGIKTGKTHKREELKEEDKKWAKEHFGFDVNDDIADAIGIGFSTIDSAF